MIPTIIAIALDLIRDAVEALQATNVAEAERQALIKAQRRISDELMKRQLT